MRLLGLKVNSYQCIEKAEIELGPGLNVLFGPNDHGKSSLASAVRAVLLMQHNSSVGEKLVSWHSGALPDVTLSFTTEERRIWRVRKLFGKTGGLSSLEFSQDGTSFSQEATARQVDDRLRELLRWGIPKPGDAKTQGMAEAFLTNVLLAEQADVPEILARGLASDKDESGRAFLGEALAALAQDPLFKRVLDAAATQVHKAFTSNGKNLSKRQGTPLHTLSTEINGLKKEQKELQEKITETQAVVAELERLQGGLDGLAAQVVQCEQDAEAARVRAGLASKLEQARRDQAELVDSRAAVAAKTSLIEELESELHHRAGEEAAARSRLEAAQAVLAEASSEHGAQALALKRGQLENESLQLQQKADSLRRALEDARLAKELKDQAEAAARDVAALEGSVAQAAERARAGEQALREAEAELERLRRLEAFAQLQEARTGLEKALESERLAREQAEHASLLLAQATAKEEEVSAAELPEPAQMAELTALAKALELAEARLGGGLSIVVRAREDRHPSVSLDGGEPQVLTGVLEAQRSFELKLDDLLEVSVTAGEATARQELQRLRERWMCEAEPVLARADADGLPELVEKCQHSAALLAEATSLRRDAAACERSAEEHRQRAQDVDLWRARVTERALPDGDQETLAAQLSVLGTGLLGRSQAAASARDAAARDSQSARTEQIGLEARLEAGRPAADALASRVRGLAPEVIELVGRRLAAEAELRDYVARADDLRQQVELLDRQAGTAAEEARQVVEQAQQEAEFAGRARADLLGKVDELRLQRAGAQGTLDQLLRRLGDPEALVLSLEAELATLPQGTGDVSSAEEALATARRAVTDQERRLTLAQGALLKVGGAVVEERKLEVDAAIARAESREHELEVDLHGWRLLAETLREVENTEGAHLGRALTGPVSERMRELCGGRYGDLVIDSNLKVEGLEAAGQARPFMTLSEGTKDQLATLFRVCIAEQIGSAVILDDHLNQSDPQRIRWFVELLRATGERIQVMLITCRPDDYLGAEERPLEGEVFRDFGRLRAVDLGRAVRRYGG